MLDNKLYAYLRKIDVQEVESLIVSTRRKSGAPRETLSYVVAVSALACLSQDIGIKNVRTYVTRTFNDETTMGHLLKTLDDSHNLIMNLAEKYEGDILKATALFAEPSRFSEIGLNSTPEGVTELAISLLDIRTDDIVLDHGSGVGSFLIRTGFEGIRLNLNGIEINTECVIISKIRSWLTGLDIDIIQGNIISQDYIHLKANKIFSNHPLGMRWSSLSDYVVKNKRLAQYFKNAKQTVSGDWVYSLAANLNLKKPGRTVVVMTNAGTWNKADEEIRKSLVHSGLVEGIILLPAKLFTSTKIPLTMMVLSHDNTSIRMVDATEIFTEGRRHNTLEADDVDAIIKAYQGESDISAKVEIADIEKQEYILNPQRYANTDAGIKNAIKLGDVCKSINRGAMIKSTDLDEMASTEVTPYRYLMLQNIQDGIVQFDLPSLREIENKYLKYCIHNNNLIISKITPFKVAMAHVKEGEQILANGNLYFVKLDEKKINPNYVEVFLQSEAGMAQLNHFAKGAAMKSISIQDLKHIQIPRIPREEQDRIAEQYETLCDELVVLQKQAAMIRDKKARLIEEVLG